MTLNDLNALTPPGSPNVNGVVDTLQYVRRFSGQTLLIKLGGAALQDLSLVKSLCEDLALIQSVGVRTVLVHGGGPAINHELTTHGITWEFFEGQRITTPNMMDLIEMVLSGSMNGKIVRTLNAAGVRAVGVSGSDASLLSCKPSSSKLGQVGEITKVNTDYLNSLLQHTSVIPVVAPVGIGKSGEAFNINADWAAMRIAVSMKIDKVIYLTDQKGILNKEGSLISELDAGELQQLIETEVVTGGMLAKARTMLFGLKNDVKQIHILEARRPHVLIEELFTNRGVGTVCQLRSRGEANS